ncbi:MSMEG_0572/Sll0783 family nitrogen starvation response protein [Gymnodinialimonas sp. 2305UL16-5]|uniref:MSMEG_0572/Sll0783 family nitrogen starvation response protein n=1 Tax=Gymnodinialimonas mytili TaxID=3126503 RepID=UPI0030B11ABD
MPEVKTEPYKDGDYFVDYEDKVFEDVQAEPGEKALITFHTVAFEGSIGLVNILVGQRLLKKGFDTSILLYGPGVTLGIQRGFPTLGDDAFPGHQNFAANLKKFMDKGGKVYACRFALQALYGHGEQSLLPGITPIAPQDVLDIVLLHRKDGAFIQDTWTL